MHTVLYRAFLGLLLLSSLAYSDQEMRHGKQEARTFKKKVSRRVETDYLLYLPEGYEQQKKERWPLIFFLHGIGERGTNAWKVAVHGPPKVAPKMTNFPFIVVSPQCPNGEWWSTDVLMTLLDDVVERYRVDQSRIYLTGLSMGGFGTWSLALEHPERWAAVAPICGGGNPLYMLSYDAKRRAALKSLPFWVFHGDKDGAVPVQESERMAAALKKFGCDVKLTIYPGVDHDSWTRTYSNPDLYTWFLKQKR
jgi:predicted peptidase